MGDTTEQSNQEETGGVGEGRRPASGGAAFTALTLARLELRWDQTLGQDSEQPVLEGWFDKREPGCWGEGRSSKSGWRARP